jgi:hypothetical protein
MMRTMKRLIPALLLLLCATSAYARMNALSCSQTDMNSAIATATAGQAVNVLMSANPTIVKGFHLPSYLKILGLGRYGSNAHCLALFCREHNLAKLSLVADTGFSVCLPALSRELGRP